MSRSIKKLLSGILAVVMPFSLTGCVLGNVQQADITEGLVRQEVVEKDTNLEEETVYIDHHHQLSEVEQTVEDPINGYCGNTITKLQECNTGKEYEFYGTESVTLTDILINMEYKQEEICNCPAEYYVDTEFATGYEINLEQGFVRCEKGQMMLTEEQVEKIREIIDRLESGEYWHYGT